MDAPDSARALERVAGALPAEVAVGAGTVLTADEARQALDAGASFVVAPGFDPAVVEVVLNAGATMIPGVFTPTEIASAVGMLLSFDAEPLCKLFPAGPVGPDFLQALKGPFASVEFMCTGGIDSSNAGEFLAAGAHSVGLGSSLFPRSALEVGDLDTIGRAVASAVTSVMAEARGQSGVDPARSPGDATGTFDLA